MKNEAEQQSESNKDEEVFKFKTMILHGESAKAKGNTGSLSPGPPPVVPAHCGE